MKLAEKPVMQRAQLLPLAAALLTSWAGTAGAADYPSTILADNPSAYYRLEETGNATTAVDSSINGVNASYNYNIENNSPLLGQPGIDTNSIVFNGGGWSGDFGFVDIPASTLITPLAANNTDSAAFSEEMWIKVPSQPPTYEVPIEVAQYPNGWNLYVSGADDGNGPDSYFILNIHSAAVFAHVVKIQFLQWNHVVVTYDGANALVYVNGVAYGPYAIAGFVPAIGSDGHIGSGQGIGWQPFNGGIDEVAFYTNVLTASQVLNHYEVGTNSFRAPPTPPTVLTDPASTTNYSGLPVSFIVGADGTLPLHYQWYENSTPVGGNSSLLSFNCQYPADNNATIQVVITNNYGSVTSQVATLTVQTNEVIANPPGSITRNVGSHAAFYVTAYGAVPITYQWSRSTDGGNTFTPISGATSAALWLTNVQMSQNGYQYAVTVTGPFTTTVVPAATLSVQSRAVNVPLNGYGAIVAADQPVAYWRLDEPNGSATAVDAVGTFDGQYTPNAGSITYGVVPPGIPNDTDPAVDIEGGATIQVPFAPELNPTTPWSVETWVRPSSLGANGGDYRVVLSSEYNQYPNPYNGWYI
ncbi:MAG TPA: LamG domain-containing protein, partial [Pseudomonadales bacterium]|nr:LamG domain-containing protein [Pseudomonadales bacterium]